MSEELVNFNLFDEVVATGHAWKRRDETRHHMKGYAMLVRGCQRFSVSNDMISKMLECGDLENTKRWCNLARLPFRKTWIEFDLRHKVRESLRRGTLSNPELHDEKQIAQRMGWLMQELDEQSGMWCMTIFVSTKGSSVEEEAVVGAVPQELVYFYAPEGPSVVMANLPKPWTRPLLPANVEHVAMGVIGSEEQDRKTYVGMVEFENRIQMGWEPVWRCINNTKPANEKRAHAATRLQEDAGILRQAIALLALLNAAPTVKTFAAPQGGHRFKGGKYLPYLSHQVVTVQLPKGGTRTLVARMNVASDNRRRHRAHSVRGHYRQVEPGKGVVHCRHEPTLVENGLGICLKCERLIRWIPEHERGDARLGWVNHDYNLENSGRAA